MPQLDLLTYFTQYLWLIIIFFSFYLIISNYIIPIISYSYKSRYKYSKKRSLISKEETKNLEDYYKNSLRIIENINKKEKKNSNEWLNIEVVNLNKKNLNNSNKYYLNTISKHLLSQSV